MKRFWKLSGQNPFGHFIFLQIEQSHLISNSFKLVQTHPNLSKLRIVLPLALSEPEPTLPFGLSLSEPTYQHLPTFLGLLNINFTEKLPKIIFFNV